MMTLRFKICLFEAWSVQNFCLLSIRVRDLLHDPKKSQLKVEFLSVPYNQTFDFVTGQFVKILTPACL